MSILDITDQCNLNCIYCCRGQKLSSIDLSNDHIVDIVTQLIKLRGTFVVLQGGEPLLKSKIVTLLYKLSQLKRITPGYYYRLIQKMISLYLSGKKLLHTYQKNLIKQGLPLYCITTNGMLYSDEIAMALYQAGFYLEISLDSHIKKVNLKTRPGICFEKVISHIKSYAENIPVEISCTITEDNAHLLPKMLLFTQDLGAICLKLSPVIMIGKRNTSETLWVKNYFLSLQRICRERKTLLSKILLKVKIYSSFLHNTAWRDLHSEMLSTQNILLEEHRCQAFKTVKDIYIDTQLNVYGCASMKNNPNFSIGNLKNSSLHDLWFSNKRNFLLNKIHASDACLNNKHSHCTAAMYQNSKFL